MSALRFTPLRQISCSSLCQIWRISGIATVPPFYISSFWCLKPKDNFFVNHRHDSHALCKFKVNFFLHEFFVWIFSVFLPEFLDRFHTFLELRSSPILQYYFLYQMDNGTLRSWWPRTMLQCCTGELRVWRRKRKSESTLTMGKHLSVHPNGLSK